MNCKREFYEVRENMEEIFLEVIVFHSSVRRVLTFLESKIYYKIIFYVIFYLLLLFIEAISNCNFYRNL